jgi:predicted nucleotide-binding protein
MNDKETILWVEDDVYYGQDVISELRDRNYNVQVANTIDEAIQYLNEDNNSLSFAVIDIMMKPGTFSTNMQTKGGWETGKELARWIKDNKIMINIIGISGHQNPDVIKWFKKNTTGFIKKPIHSDEIVRLINQAKTRAAYRDIKTFIVHGQDEETKYKLKNFLQNNLKLPEPIILHEQPGYGRTIIEKFEDIADIIDIVFVLLTPDDIVKNGNESDDLKRRARQNVIFEMGYFMGKIERKQGRVILLYKKPLELPSDINGIQYIDISNGLDTAYEAIRTELQDFM